MNARSPSALCLALFALFAAPPAAARGGEGLRVATETYTLPNGMTVTLHEDHTLPKVVINTWFAVGSKDERPGRTGFAHLFEHLMFMGTGRVPGNQFDVIMETGGGWNNASTSNDRTNYYSEGPASLLPTLLWLDADRLDALPDHMTQEKLDAQRGIVRNERRQTSENVPYGRARLLLPEAMFPVGHPYHHPVIGSHEDLEAATVEDVVDFFHEHYVPANASLVVAGDFDPQAVKDVIARTFGAIPGKPVPERHAPEPFTFEGERRLVGTDNVQFPKLFLAWHSPAYFTQGDAEMDMMSSILADGPSSWLEQRLVFELGIAQEVAAYQWSGELGSRFQVEALAAPGADLEQIKREILAELERMATDGPEAEELASAQARTEAGFLRNMEGLGNRADSLNQYRHYFGVADGFQRDLDRYLNATPDSLAARAREVFGHGRVDLRIFPEGEAVAEASLDERPEAFPAGSFTPPAVASFELSNGIAVHAVARPGTGLFSGSLIVRGGESAVSPGEAGRASLLASVMESGAGGLDAAAFATAVESLGARTGVSARVGEMIVSVSGLASRAERTLELFADLALRPNMRAEDFERELGLALAAIEKRQDQPRAVATTVVQHLAFGDEDPFGRPLDGWTHTMERADLADLEGYRAVLLHPDQASLVFVGDFDPGDLREGLERRFGSWRSDAAVPTIERTPSTEASNPRTVLVHRPDAPQTMIYLMRPVPAAEGVERAVRECVNVVLGGSFTSRLNTNLRERNAFSYGARSSIRQQGQQFTATALSAVFTDKTGAALQEFQAELARLNAEGVTAEEVQKAVETLRTRIVAQAETTRSLSGALVGAILDGRPLDSMARDLAALDGVTLEAANAFARSGFYAWDGFLVVLVGDRDAVLPQLEQAGLPAPMEVDPDGRML